MPALILPLWMTHDVLKLESLAFKIEKNGVGMGKVRKTKTFYWEIKALTQSLSSKKEYTK